MFCTAWKRLPPHLCKKRFSGEPVTLQLWMRKGVKVDLFVQGWKKCKFPCKRIKFPSEQIKISHRFYMVLYTKLVKCPSKYQNFLARSFLNCWFFPPMHLSPPPMTLKYSFLDNCTYCTGWTANFTSLIQYYILYYTLYSRVLYFHLHIFSWYHWLPPILSY